MILTGLFTLQDRQGEFLARQWSDQLGLAFSPLSNNDTDHFALLDGVEGSFALSTQPIDPQVALDWTWSSQLGSHVQASEQNVLVRQIDQKAPVLSFDRSAVDSYLEKFLSTILERRRDPAISVVEHVVQCFRSHRHSVADARISQESGLAMFLNTLDQMISPDEAVDAIFSDAKALPFDHFERLRDELSFSKLAGRKADLRLTIRHAAGFLFQEAHAELSTEPIQLRLFGLGDTPRQSTRNALGAYYTPPGLARTLADIALKPYVDQKRVQIFDPACGSGIFLCEAVRSLQRHNFSGEIELLGFDISRSAIEMARFALAHSDLPRGTKVTLRTGDFLTVKSSAEFDAILMNPPFISFQDLSSSQQELVQALLGSDFKYRPDYSLLFATHALSFLREGGTLATLLPAGVLSQSSAADWRRRIAQSSAIDLIAVLGDHGLFRDAMVNIAALVMRKDKPGSDFYPAMLWASQKSGASASALRRLRRWANGDRRPERNSQWSIYSAPEKLLANRDDWLPRPNSLGDLPLKLSNSPAMVRVPELFRVELGIRVGDRKKFVVNRELVGELPSKERGYFRPIAEKSAIRMGRIYPADFLFYPSEPMTVKELRRTLPEFYKRHLSALKLAPDDVLSLARPRRETMESGEPRLVSRAFVSVGSFAVDLLGENVVVQGYSWLPQSALKNSPYLLDQLLTDYCFIFNSRLFFLLVREFGRIVAGGQVDVSQHNMKMVPIPDLARIYIEEPEVAAMAEHLRNIDQSEFPPLAEIDRFAAAAYRTKLQEWPSHR